MASKILESQVEAGLVRYAKKHGIYTRKFTSPSQRGVPDRIFAYNGRVLFLEIKRKGEKPTKLQKYELEQLQEAGIAASWVDNVESGIDMINAVLTISIGEGLTCIRSVNCACGCCDNDEMGML